MRKQEILQAVREALGASRIVRVSFKEKETVGVNYLLGLAMLKTVKLSDGDQNRLIVTSQFNDWGEGGDANRTVTILLAEERFDESRFAETMSSVLEKISVVY